MPVRRWNFPTARQREAIPCAECGQPLRPRSANHVRHPSCAIRQIRRQRKAAIRDRRGRPKGFVVRPLHGPRAHPYAQAADRIEAELKQRIPWGTVFENLEQRTDATFRAMVEWCALERRRTFAAGGHSKRCRCALCILQVERPTKVRGVQS